jgi:phosphoenolpyruvate carboxykinase (ATP)
VNAAVNGELDKGKFREVPVFRLMVPESCPGVDAKLLEPRRSWADPAAYDAKAEELKQRFEQEFAKHKG